MKGCVLFWMALILWHLPASAQVVRPVTWASSARELNDGTVELVFKATISKPWHMYGLNIPEGGPIPASIHFNDTNGFVIAGVPVQEPAPELVDDKIFNMRLELHSGEVTFRQRIRKTSPGEIEVSGTIEYMTCSDMQCVLGENDFSFSLKGAAGGAVSTAVQASAGKTAEGTAAGGTTVEADTNAVYTNGAKASGTGVSPVISSTPSSEGSKGTTEGSLWGILMLAMLGGVGGLLTPCVYPMIPMTVSYFIRGKKARSRAVAEALFFGLSIVLIYTLVGLLVAVFKNPNAVNNFTTHWAVNLVFFFVFLALAASFFGAFEIVLPSALANKVDRQADRGGFLGAFFMALAMVLLSFSCTGPIVASLLIKASGGNVMEPVIGMAGFSFVFALPFTLFAVFPSWLKGLPRSGGWLNEVKVSIAFVLLAYSLYFLSKTDQVYHLNILSRELYLSIWIVIFLLLGFYLLGKIRFAHDEPVGHVGLLRLMFVLISFSFSVFLLTGLAGNDLKSLSSILPPKKVSAETSTFALPSSSPASGTAFLADICGSPLYSDFLNLPHGLGGYFDYKQALACARAQNKPLLIDFVGHTCSNCKKMYGAVWSDPRVLELLKTDFVIAALYTDDKTRLPESQWITSGVDGKVKNTIGKVNQDIQISLFNSNALPLYVVVGPDGSSLTRDYYTYNTNPDDFIAWLEEALETMRYRQTL